MLASVDRHATLRYAYGSDGAERPIPLGPGPGCAYTPPLAQVPRCAKQARQLEGAQRDGGTRVPIPTGVRFHGRLGQVVGSDAVRGRFSPGSITTMLSDLPSGGAELRRGQRGPGALFARTLVPLPYVHGSNDSACDAS